MGAFGLRVTSLAAGVSLVLTGCGGGAKAKRAVPAVPLSKTQFCQRYTAYDRALQSFQSANSISDIKRDLPVLISEGKAMMPAPAGIQSDWNAYTEDLIVVNNWAQGQPNNLGNTGAFNGAPASVKNAADDLPKHTAVKDWVQANCPGVVAGS